MRHFESRFDEGVNPRNGCRSIPLPLAIGPVLSIVDSTVSRSNLRKVQDDGWRQRKESEIFLRNLVSADSV